MAKIRVLVTFEFDEVNPGSPEEDEIVQTITEARETMQTGFDAQDCWVDDVVYVENATEEA